MVPKNEVAPLTSGSFPIVTDPQAKDLMMSTLDLGVSQFDLKRLRMPLGGGSAWSVETLTGEEMFKEIDAVILMMKGGEKAWWKAAMEDGGDEKNPSCSSHDGMTGWGVNSLDEDAVEGKHDCKSCHWNQFGSARGKGDGKDCKDSAKLFLFLENSRIPALLIVPATSLKSLSKYSMMLIDAGKSVEGVVSKLTLDSTMNKAGIKFSTLKLAYVEDLPEDGASRMSDLAKQFRARITANPSDLPDA
jgi:hypothetical protein